MRKRLSNAEIGLLLFLFERVGLRGRMTLTSRRRRYIVGLWRRELVEIWFRRDPREGAMRGPYFSLTIEGHLLADTLLAGRDARSAQQSVTRKSQAPQVAA